MKLLRFVFPLSVPLLVLAGHAAGGCGGSSSPASSGNPPPGGSDGGPGVSGGDGGQATAPGDSGAKTDAGFTIPDGGFVLPTVEAGSGGSFLPGAPGVVQCGPSGNCDVGSNTCCANSDGGTSCAPGASATCPQVALHCAQAADCQAGQVCCAVFNASNASLVASCSSGTCGTDQQTPPGAQLCSTTAECQNGQACTKQSCQGQTLELCGLFDYTLPGVVTVACVAE